jgi:hypothetical protein
MAKKASKESLPLIVSLVFFVLLSIGLGVFCYVLNSDQAAKDQAVEGAKKDKAAAQAIAKDAELTAAVLRTYIGIPEGDDQTKIGTEVKEGDKAATALKQVNDLTAKQLGVEPGNLWAPDFDDKKMLKPPPRPGGLVGIVTASAAARNAIVTEMTARKKDYEAAREAMKEKQDAYEKDAAEMRKVAAEAPNQFKAQLNNTNKRADDQNKVYVSEITKARNDEQGLKDEKQRLEVELKRAEDRAKELRFDINTLQSKVKAKEDVFQFDEPQGKVTRRISDDVVEIDLGSSALVRPGLTFTVLPIDFPEKGRQSRMQMIRTPDERGNYHSVERFVPKADIEVIEVLGPNLSRARIVTGTEADRIRDRVMTGDLLYNAVWRKGTADHIVLVGIFDTNGDGTDDLEAVIRDLTRMGIPVDAYYDLRKRHWVGRITEQTRYVVQGAVPLVSPADPNREAKSTLIGGINGALTDARQKGLSVVDYRDFFPRMGYKIRSDVGDDKINQAAARYLGGVTATPDTGNPNDR